MRRTRLEPTPSFLFLHPHFHALLRIFVQILRSKTSVTMSSVCRSLSPSPAIPMGPISTISADEYLGIESDHGDESSRPKRNGSSDLESGDRNAADVENHEIRSANETIHLPSGHQRLRSKILQRSKTSQTIIKIFVWSQEAERRCRLSRRASASQRFG